MKNSQSFDDDGAKLSLRLRLGGRNDGAKLSLRLRLGGRNDGAKLSLRA